MQTIRGINEKDLIVRLREGDRTAFELIFHFYYPGLVIYVSQFTFDRDDAEEIVQDFFVRFWQIHQNIFLSDSLKNYFFSSVKNRSLNYLKHKKIEENYLKEIYNLTNKHLLYDTNLYVTSELQDKIKDSINLLPEKCREIFLMSRTLGMKNEEIALKLNLSKRTIETQISNAIKVLRVELKDFAVLLIFFGMYNF